MNVKHTVFVRFIFVSYDSGYGKGSLKQQVDMVRFNLKVDQQDGLP